MAFTIFSKNGSILPLDQAILPVTNIEFSYGFGVYETIRVVHRKPFFLDQHIERLWKSAEEIGLHHELSSALLLQWVQELIENLEGDSFNLKILLIGAREPKDVKLFILPLNPLFPDKRELAKGATAVTYRHERFLPHAKTLNMLPSYIAYSKAREKGCFDALFINRDECITEGTRTNFLCLRGRTILSPPREEILEGVTLMNLMRVAEEKGFPVVYEPIPLKDIRSFDGAFLTSATSKIMPLVKIDEVSFSVPETLKELMKHFDEFLDPTSPAGYAGQAPMV